METIQGKGILRWYKLNLEPNGSLTNVRPTNLWYYDLCVGVCISDEKHKVRVPEKPVVRGSGSKLWTKAS